MIDLGSTKNIGRVEFYTATLPDTPIPALAMPIEYRIDVLRDLGKNDVVKSTLLQ